jgi:DNA-binding CsgD family transcriptional regulator
VSFSEKKTIDQHSAVIDLMAIALEVSGVATSLDVNRVLRGALKDLGFDYFHLQRFKFKRFIGAPWHKLPATLMAETVRAEGPDSIAVRALDLDQPFWWNDYAARTSTAARDRYWLQSLSAMGLRNGATVAVHGSNGMSDVVHIASKSDHLPLAADQATLTAASALVFLCCQALRRFDEQTIAAQVTEARLSARELEVLRWCKDGKSYSEIGTIMGISSKTVEFHIANVMRKLGVNQKVTAIVEALRQGLISL